MNKSRGKICLRACDEGNFCAVFYVVCLKISSEGKIKNYDYVGYGSQKSIFWLTTDFQSLLKTVLNGVAFSPFFSVLKFSRVFLFFTYFSFLENKLLLLLLPRSGFSCLNRVHVRIHHKSILPLTNFFPHLICFTQKRKKTLVLCFG